MDDFFVCNELKMNKLKIMQMYVKSKLGRLSPVHISFQVTNACNLNCAYCYANSGKPKENELTTEEAFKLIDDIVELKPYVLVLDGGEPLLRKDLPKLIEYAFKKGLNTCVATNGLLLNKEKAQKFKELGLGSFHFSLDGSNNKIHSIHRGDNFINVMMAINFSVEIGIKTVVQTMVTHKNIDDLENIARLLKFKKIDLWRLQFVIPSGRGTELIKSENFSTKERLEIAKKVYDLSRKYEKDFKIHFHDSPIYRIYKHQHSNYKERKMLEMMGGCGVVDGTILNVDSDGFVRPCPYFQLKLKDNVKDKKLKDIYYNNETLKTLRKKSIKRCKKCEYFKICSGGCKSEIYNRTGKLLEENINCFLEA